MDKKEKKVTLKDKLKNEEVIENKDNTDDMSDLEEDSYSKVTQDENKQQAITNELKQKIITYIKIDDAVRKKQEEIKHLKEMKKPCEEAIITHLESIQEDAFNLISGDRLIKNKVEHKAPLKVDFIKDAIKEELIKENMVQTQERCDFLINEILEMIDKKRPVKTKVSLRRAVPKQKKQK